MPTSVDLSTYVRVGRYDLPEPTRTTPPANSLLAQEVSAVTYNGDTDTLFVVGDGGTSIVQVSKTGQLINSMTLAPGNSPQGTTFYDTEGLTYVGGGKFVLIEERDRQANLFTYVAGGTLTRSDVQTVKLGTTIGNIGIEGISYDPSTGGFIAVKETQPEGIFQTGINFAAGTATNGSATTVNSTDLFNPALAGLLDFADVFALSNLSYLNGQTDSSHLLVLSQESGKIVNIDRAGNISSSLTIVSDPGNPLSVADQQHEGITMDNNGFLYVTSENGGGDINHPQVWVYAPSTVPNQAPTAVALNNKINAILENTSTATRIKVADIAITDDGLGTNNLTVSGVDASFFEADSSGLYIKAGTVLDYETKTSYSLSVNVDDSTVGSTPDATTIYTLAVTDVVNEGVPPLAPLIISEVHPAGSGNGTYAADWFELTNTGTSALDITGWKIDDNSNSFAASVALVGVSSIGAGQSVVFLESTAPATAIAAFKTAWFGSNVPIGFAIGSYSGSGVGLSTTADAVNIYNAAGTLQANVTFSTATASKTFDNAAGLNNGAIAQLSGVGVSGAFLAANGAETGSPGTIRAPQIIEQVGGATLSVLNGLYQVTDKVTNAIKPVSYAGNNVGTNSFVGWSVIGAEITGTDVKAMWKTTSGLFWYSTNTDNGGLVADVLPYETTFQQDFNGDGIIGAAATTVESFGTTKLLINANNQYLANNGSTSINLKYAGNNVGPNSFAGWSVIGTEIAGADVKAMWKTTSGLFWYSTNTDNGGLVNDVVPYETAFQQDFNGDGIIGAFTTIESFGTTKLLVDANNQYIAKDSTGVVNLKYGGVNIGPNSFAGWSVVGAEIDAGTVKAMWKTNSGLFWYSTNTDNGGLVANVASYESPFQQDFNGNGMIGS